MVSSTVFRRLEMKVSSDLIKREWGKSPSEKTTITGITIIVVVSASAEKSSHFD